jgi:SAM-dependent methyltransferase
MLARAGRQAKRTGRLATPPPDWYVDGAPAGGRLQARMDKILTEPGIPAHGGRDAVPWPLRLEVDAVRRVLETVGTEGRACLDIGFRHPHAPARLRRDGGYWSSVAPDRHSAARLAAALREEVPPLGQHGQLPFEDKQFDTVVIALGTLSGEPAADEALVRECHRVLKAPGYLVLTVEFAKPLGLAHLLSRGRRPHGVGGRYTEAALFDLFRHGFDWLGSRRFCRFWVRMVWLWADRRHPGHGEPAAFPCWLARRLDDALFMTRGYLLTAYARRKGWRPRQTPVLADGRTIQEAVLHKLGR